MELQNQSPHRPANREPGTATVKLQTDHAEFERDSLLVRVTSQIVAMTFGLEQKQLLDRKRGPNQVSRARQVTAYLLHTTLSMSLVDIGRMFQKDRTTIGHACRMVEDLRDEPDFDDRINDLEATLHLIKNLANNTL